MYGLPNYNDNMYTILKAYIMRGGGKIYVPKNVPV